MFKSFITTAIAVAFLAVTGASAATVDMSANGDRIFTLNDVTDATLSFSVPTTGKWEGFGGTVKWSTREDGPRDDDGPWGKCLECGYFGGTWNVYSSPWIGAKNSASEMFVDFGDARETVFLWVNPTHGTGSVTLTSTGGSASSGTAGAGSSVAPVPLPAGGWLLLSALGAAVALRHRKTR